MNRLKEIHFVDTSDLPTKFPLRTLHFEHMVPNTCCIRHSALGIRLPAFNVRIINTNVDSKALHSTFSFPHIFRSSDIAMYSSNALSLLYVLYFIFVPHSSKTFECFAFEVPKTEYSNSEKTKKHAL